MKHPFPLELVSNIAARLLEGDKYEEAARRALALLEACAAEIVKADPVARMMVALGGNEAEPNKAGGVEAANLDPAAAKVSDEAKPVASKAKAAVKATATKDNHTLPPAMKFEDAAVYVTGQKRADRALPLFRRFLKHCIRTEKAMQAMGRSYLLPQHREQHKAQYDATPETTDEELAERVKELPKMILSHQLFDWKDWFAGWRTQKMTEANRLKGQKGAAEKKARRKK